MKQIIIVICAVIISGCATKYKKRDLIGKWEEVSITNMETGEVEIREGEPDRILVLLTMDSLYTISEHYNFYPDDHIHEKGISWEVIGDSIFVDWMSFFIKELRSDHIILVEYASFPRNSKQETKFRRIK